MIEPGPLVAILRDVRPSEVVAIARAIYAAGIDAIEVPLNSPDPLDSIARLAAELPDDCLVGAGTVLDPAAVDDVVAAGGRLIVSPDANEDVVKRALDKQVLPMPGVATATEALLACSWGACLLKLFPAATYGPGHVAALRDVLPRDGRVYAVGGIGGPGGHDLAAWLAAGVAGFGIGSQLYRPGDTATLVGQRAERLVAALADARRDA